jgi:TolB-like protein
MRRFPVPFLFGLLLAAADVRPAEPVTVAVLYFDNNSLVDKEHYEGLRKGLCDIMITELSKVSGLKVVEREQLQKLLAEMALGQSGAVDESTAPKVGKLLGAKVLMLGSFMRDMGEDMRIDARLVDVESGAVLKAEEASGNAAKVFKLTKKLTYKILADLNVSASSEEKKRIESADRMSFDALSIYSEGLELFDKGEASAAARKFEQVLSIDKSFERARVMLGRCAEGR